MEVAICGISWIKLVSIYQLVGERQHLLLCSHLLLKVQGDYNSLLIYHNCFTNKITYNLFIDVYLFRTKMFNNIDNYKILSHCILIYISYIIIHGPC